MSKDALKAALHGELTNALAKFRRDLAYTAPELIDMRIRQLDERLREVIDTTVDALG